jgi:hypothetical protein
MSSRNSFRSTFVAGLVGMALLAAACSTSTDPGTWEEAEANGDKVRLNFDESCQEANLEAVSSGDVPAYCECSYGVIREFYADDFQAFRDAESELRSNPEAINDNTVIPAELKALLEECARQYLA